MIKALVMALSLQDLRAEVREWIRVTGDTPLAGHTPTSWRDMMESIKHLDKQLDNPAAPESGRGSAAQCEERLRRICINLRAYNDGRKPGR